mmetsp:Transcript_17314/g.32793  ORF Transcript_17314/g.32793 Transcript_17314/m.32793 type:complete len:605 (+) Transcript_17314:320-2134(+)|eukprot:CAMPEP_0176486688 /NCGR_PEP_ID=MMETSP0200_2-20121128/5704_1 /TAXON_ID=947934 /ORGANISM="Chaetoceros sp., Strain GSL56" /LENGTH=604 /DNA_ID=CAMNT_0017883411 /DNA_START=277 /DNA_END=2091 /DNA_ORIENTATION=-
MHLTSDEKLVASAMAGLKRPHQSQDINSTSSEDNTMASASPVMGASASPFSKRMKGNTHEPQFNGPDVTSPGANIFNFPPKIVTTTTTHASTETTINSAVAGSPAAGNVISHESQEQEHRLDPRHQNDHSPSVSCGQLEAMSITLGPHSDNQIDDQENSSDSPASNHRELLPAPYFYYRDFSQTPDDDPLTPLTPLARVPNFPAKMHAILSREDLADVVTWMPHGRSWKVLKPREFEIRVIPAYFEHSKFSSFIRQANGWGFRRITRGKDRNSYYHELFLRGLPHLCKKMRRPGVSKKLTVDVGHEPDLYQISQEFPVPEKMENSDSIMLPNTLLGGPKARMPVGLGTAYMASSGNGKETNNSMNHNQFSTPWHSGNGFLNASAAAGQQYASSASGSNSTPNAGAWLAAQKMPHRHQFMEESSDLKMSAGKPEVPQPSQAMQSLKDAIGTNLSTSIPILPRPFGIASYQPAGATSFAAAAAHAQNLAQTLQRQQQLQQQLNQCNGVQLSSSVSQLQQQAFGNSQQQATSTFHQALSAAAAAMGSEPTSQFAAGFAAAAALSNPHFQRAFHQALAQAAAPSGSNSTVAHGGVDSATRQEESLKDR